MGWSMAVMKCQPIWKKQPTRQQKQPLQIHLMIQTAETASDAETELDSSSEDLYGNGDTEATDPEESSSEFYE